MIESSQANRVKIRGFTSLKNILKEMHMVDFCVRVFSVSPLFTSFQRHFFDNRVSFKK